MESCSLSGGGKLRLGEARRVNWVAGNLNVRQPSNDSPRPLLGTPPPSFPNSTPPSTSTSSSPGSLSSSPRAASPRAAPPSRPTSPTSSHTPTAPSPSITSPGLNKQPRSSTLATGQIPWTALALRAHPSFVVPPKQPKARSPRSGTRSHEKTFLTTRANAHATVRRADNRPGGNLRTRVSRGTAID